MRETFLAMALGLTWASCHMTGAAAPAKVAMGEPFSVKVGASALVESEKLQIEFTGVPTDSRCPRGEQCIVEGDAVVRIVAQQVPDAKEALELHTSTKQPNAVAFLGFGIRLVRLDPYPVSGRSVRPADYVATLEVTRGTPAGGAEIR